MAWLPRRITCASIWAWARPGYLLLISLRCDQRMYCTVHQNACVCYSKKSPINQDVCRHNTGWGMSQFETKHTLSPSPLCKRVKKCFWLYPYLRQINWHGNRHSYIAILDWTGGAKSNPACMCINQARPAKYLCFCSFEWDISLPVQLPKIVCSNGTNGTERRRRRKMKAEGGRGRGETHGWGGSERSLCGWTPPDPCHSLLPHAPHRWC